MVFFCNEQDQIRITFCRIICFVAISFYVNKCQHCLKYEKCVQMKVSAAFAWTRNRHTKSNKSLAIFSLLESFSSSPLQNANKSKKVDFKITQSHCRVNVHKCFEHYKCTVQHESVLVKLVFFLFHWPISLILADPQSFTVYYITGTNKNEKQKKK